MNKRLLVGMFTALMALAPLSGYADQTIDSPHLNINKPGETEACTECHFANYQPGDCVRCHANAAEVPNGAIVSTHKNLDCQACHNPHVSLQGNGITGTYSAIQADIPSTGMTTLSGVTPTPDLSWAEKTAPERGMILWIANGNDAQGNPQFASFEVKGIDAANATVTVKGIVPVVSGSFELRRGQLIAKKVTKTAGSSYRQGDLAVEFPSASGNTSIFIDTQHGSTPTGVCQVCHTNTLHWTSNGGGADHNPDKVCTTCHKHSSGFAVTGCTSCHPGADPDGAPTAYPGQMASPSTGSQTAGQHLVHATAQGYNFQCSTCHSGTGMDRLNAPNNPVKGDGIQIGFSNVGGKFQGYMTSYNGQASVDGVGTHSHYVGTNHTTVTNTGAVNQNDLKCSNVYCHSDGTAIRRGCTVSMPNTSPAWDGSSPDPQGDATKCNNCHGYTKLYGNAMSTAMHTTHVTSLTFPCYYCHNNTVDSAGAIKDTSKHVNGVYDVASSGTPRGTGTVTFTYDPTTHGCSGISGCHADARKWTDSRYGSYQPDAGTCPDVCSSGITNDDPVIAPYAFPNDPINTADSTQAFVYANDPNTLHIKIRTNDTDDMDIVKNQCRKGSDPAKPTYGGHYDQAGFIRTIFADQCNTFIYDAKFPNAGYGEKELTCRYSDAKLAATGGKMCWTYALSDNDPTSYNQLVANGWTAPNGVIDGLAAPYSIGVSPPEWACINPTINPAVMLIGPVDSNNKQMNNVFPVVTKTVSVVGKKVSITFTATDPDQVDADKQAYWAAQYPGKTGGHGASTNHYVQINWFNEGLTKENSNPTNPTALQMTAAGGSKTYWFDFNNDTGISDGVATTSLSGMTNPPGTGKARTNVWVQAYVCDNHVLGVDGQMNKDCYDTGWFQVNFQ